MKCYYCDTYCSKPSPPPPCHICGKREEHQPQSPSCITEQLKNAKADADYYRRNYNAQVEDKARILDDYEKALEAKRKELDTLKSALCNLAHS